MSGEKERWTVILLSVLEEKKNCAASNYFKVKQARTCAMWKNKSWHKMANKSKCSLCKTKGTWFSKYWFHCFSLFPNFIHLTMVWIGLAFKRNTEVQNRHILSQAAFIHATEYLIDCNKRYSNGTPLCLCKTRTFPRPSPWMHTHEWDQQILWRGQVVVLSILCHDLRW